MRKIIICFLMGFLISVQAQFQFAGSYEYGQILDVVYHPDQENTVYGRTVTNHIVKSTDLGETWEVIHSVPQENWYITVKDLRLTGDGNSLSYICSAEGTIYNRVEILNLATEEVEKEIVSPIGPAPGSLLQSYSLAKDNTDIALFHTTKIIDWGLVTEIFYTTDGGTIWHSVYYGPDNGDINVNNVAISPYDSEKLFIMRGASPNPVEGGLLISEDAGQTWVEKLPETNFSALTFHPENENEIFLGTFYLGSGQEENLYKSTDGGETWNIVPINWTSNSTNSIHTILFNPSNHDNILILEENEIVISNDAGQTWENHVHAGNDYETEYYYGVAAAFNPFDENQVIISANYYPFISNDGGVTIQKFRTPFLHGSPRMSTHIGEENHIYYGLRSGIIHLDLQTQEENAIGMLPLGQMSPHTRSGVFADAHKTGRIFFTNMAMMGNSSLFMSDDHGANFGSVFSGSYLMLIAQASLPSNPDKALVSFGELLYKFDFTDPANPTNQELMLPSFGSVEALIFDTDENQFFIAQQNKVFKTEDGGQTWTDSSSGLEILANTDFIYDLKRNPLNAQQLGLATSKGVFISDDNGLNWNQIYENGPMNRVEFSPFLEGKIVASSRFEDGSYYPESISKTVFTKNGGESWAEISTDELGHLRTVSTEIIFNGENSADTYFLTPDLGLVQYTLDLTTMGMDDAANNHSALTIYPNPTTSIFNVHSTDKVEKLVLFDMTGKKLIEQPSAQLNISFLPKGIYIVQIELANGKTSTKKIVKQ